MLFNFQVYHELVSSTQLSASSPDFSLCTFYNVKIIAIGRAGNVVMKETALLRKVDEETLTQPRWDCH